MIDMRGNMVAGILVAAAGAALVRSLRPHASNLRRRFWVPLVAFLSGPLFACGWCIVEICFISPAYYVHPDDFIATLIPMVVVGTVAGAMAATAFWLAER